MDPAPTRSILVCALLAITLSCKDKSVAPSSANPGDEPVTDHATGQTASASGCLGDEGGCQVKPASIEPCPDDLSELKPISLDQVLSSPGDYSGKQIALRGPLMKSGSGCTEMACEQTCCNTCTAIVTIGDARTERFVRLESRNSPGLYRCIGDESMVCCQTDARGQEVIIQGTFQAAAGMSPPIYQLWATELCVPL